MAKETRDLIAELRKEADAAEWIGKATSVELPPLIRNSIALYRRAADALEAKRTLDAEDIRWTIDRHTGSSVSDAVMDGIVAELTGQSHV